MRSARESLSRFIREVVESMTNEQFDWLADSMSAMVSNALDSKMVWAKGGNYGRRTGSSLIYQIMRPHIAAGIKDVVAAGIGLREDV